MVMGDIQLCFDRWRMINHGAAAVYQDCPLITELHGGWWATLRRQQIATLFCNTVRASYWSLCFPSIFRPKKGVFKAHQAKIGRRLSHINIGYYESSTVGIVSCLTYQHFRRSSSKKSEVRGHYPAFWRVRGRSPLSSSSTNSHKPSERALKNRISWSSSFMLLAICSIFIMTTKASRGKSTFSNHQRKNTKLLFYLHKSQRHFLYDEF